MVRTAPRLTFPLHSLRLQLCNSRHFQFSLFKSCAFTRRFGVGFSSTGSVLGTATSVTSVVVCNPASSVTPVAQYHLTGFFSSNLTVHNTNGTSDMKLTATATKTIMTWTRQAFNGDPNDAQIPTGAALGDLGFVWVVGDSLALPMSNSAPIPLVSGYTSMASLPVIASCPYTSLDDKLQLAWRVQGNQLTVSAIVTGGQRW